MYLLSLKQITKKTHDYKQQQQDTVIQVNGWQLAKMKKGIPDMSLP